jgi:hypothetical protein
MEDFRKYPQMPIWLPDHPEVKKIISVPDKMTYINLAAAPTANVIRLVQDWSK